MFYNYCYFSVNSKLPQWALPPDSNEQTIGNIEVFIVCEVQSVINQLRNNILFQGNITACSLVPESFVFQYTGCKHRTILQSPRLNPRRVDSRI